MRQKSVASYHVKGTIAISGSNKIIILMILMDARKKKKSKACEVTSYVAGK